jgi:hypothetical protein
MTTEPQDTPDPTALVRDVATRATVAIGLLGVGLIHLLDSIDKWSETRYQFWMFMALILGSLTVAGALLFTRSRLAMPAAIALTASALAGFCLSRSTGLPNATGDIGNWTEPIGLANLFIEGAILAVAVPAVTLSGLRRRVRVPATARPTGATASATAR